MKKGISILSAVAGLVLLASCSVTQPLSVSAAPIGTKTGKSSTVVFLGIQFNKDFSIAEAAKKGKITGGVGIADLKTTGYFFFKKKEIIVHGE